jgi:hypothetical protein
MGMRAATRPPENGSKSHQRNKAISARRKKEMALPPALLNEQDYPYYAINALKTNS